MFLECDVLFFCGDGDALHNKLGLGGVMRMRCDADVG